MKKWIAVLLCAALLVVGMPSTRAVKAEDVYFTAVNISLLKHDPLRGGSVRQTGLKPFL